MGRLLPVQRCIMTGEGASGSCELCRGAGPDCRKEQHLLNSLMHCTPSQGEEAPEARGNTASLPHLRGQGNLPRQPPYFQCSF